MGDKSLRHLSRHSCSPTPSQSCPLLPPVTEGVGNKSNSVVYRIVTQRLFGLRIQWQATTLNMSWLLLWHIFRVGSSNVIPQVTSKIRLRNPIPMTSRMWAIKSRLSYWSLLRSLIDQGPVKCHSTASMVLLRIVDIDGRIHFDVLLQHISNIQ